MSNETKQQMTPVDAALCDLSLPPTHPAMWITCSPHEWKWSQADQERMARDILYLGKEVFRLREENAKLRDLTQWRPIESAPKKGRLLLLDSTGFWRIGFWNTQRYCKDPEPFWDYDSCFREVDSRSMQPKWWLPLPAAPESEGEQ